MIHHEVNETTYVLPMATRATVNYIFLGSPIDYEKNGL